MRPRHEHAHHAGVHTREELEAQFGPVLDVRGFARHFILIGIDSLRVVVRRKGGDNAKGTLRYQPRPLLFYQFVPVPGDSARPTR